MNTAPPIDMVAAGDAFLRALLSPLGVLAIVALCLGVQGLTYLCTHRRGPRTTRHRPATWRR